MEDPWKYIAFPTAALTGYLISLGVSGELAGIIMMPEFTTSLIVIGVTGFLAGFMVDQVIPAYIEKVRTRRGGEGGFDDGGEDIDFE